MTYSVSETAERSGFSVETLRYYERIDLVIDVPRDTAGRRVYGEEHLAWLGMLRCLRETGMPIQQMSDYAEPTRGQATVPCTSDSICCANTPSTSTPGSRRCSASECIWTRRSPGTRHSYHRPPDAMRTIVGIRSAGERV